MLMVHGGAFILFDSKMKLDHTAVSEEVVVVGINYRLGALGFFANGKITRKLMAIYF
jgi:carboxylesterase type B